MRLLTKIVIILGVAYALIASVTIVNAASLSQEQKSHLKEQCDALDAEACGDLWWAITVEKGSPSEEDLNEIIGLMYKACDLGHAFSCVFIGSYGNEQQAAEYYKKACDLGDSFGCRALGTSYLAGQGVQQSSALAAEYLKKACDLEDGSGCSLLGAAYYVGQGVQQNYALAVELLKKACDLEDGSGCCLLGAAYYEGEGVQQNSKIQVIWAATKTP